MLRKISTTFFLPHNSPHLSTTYIITQFLLLVDFPNVCALQPFNNWTLAHCQKTFTTAARVKSGDFCRFCRTCSALINGAWHLFGFHAMYEGVLAFCCFSLSLSDECQENVAGVKVANWIFLDIPRNKKINICVTDTTDFFLPLNFLLQQFF